MRAVVGRLTWERVEAHLYAAACQGGSAVDVIPA